MTRYQDPADREEWSEAERQARDNHLTIRQFQQNYAYTTKWLATHAEDDPLRPNTLKQQQQALEFLQSIGAPLQ
jgi:hypothetical protein